MNKEAPLAMVNLLTTLKERSQQMQVVYHIRLLHLHDHILLGSFHIEEDIYGLLHYLPKTTHP